MVGLGVWPITHLLKPPCYGTREKVKTHRKRPVDGITEGCQGSCGVVVSRIMIFSMHAQFQHVIKFYKFNVFSSKYIKIDDVVMNYDFLMTFLFDNSRALICVTS
ncbi:hypothetical protein CWI36_0231p0030 [Hamiltosporidium magnivora]|uniref:Uncharacterized protein n=1 Tax=Hamiltosporidium magnivora TaxID=148818 RepID=A0A4Q9LKX5_9MICR|nr:hypothetical protein CWI36_0260p0030 [Hamiltosporidium magnivora]TBU07760.1 hypothetical protein CWI36_0231p0030 [Hamiltosporidium magnivora]